MQACTLQFQNTDIVISQALLNSAAEWISLHKEALPDHMDYAQRITSRPSQPRDLQEAARTKERSSRMSHLTDDMGKTIRRDNPHIDSLQWDVFEEGFDERSRKAGAIRNEALNHVVGTIAKEQGLPNFPELFGQRGL